MKIPRRAIDITGKSFGNWTALAFSGTGARDQAIWKFQCKCGNVKELYAHVVKRGNIKSCGCIKGKDISGLRFGKLIAIQNTGRQLPIRKSYFWKCLCDCGNETEVWISNLINGHTRSCGCLISDVLRIRNTTHGMTKTPEYRRMRSRIHKDKYRGLDSEWTLRMERELKEFFPSCVVCESSEDLEIDHVMPKSKGYGLKPGNVVILCHNHNCLGFKGRKLPEELSIDVRDKILNAAKSFETHWNSIIGIVQ